VSTTVRKTIYLLPVIRGITLLSGRNILVISKDVLVKRGLNHHPQQTITKQEID